MFGLEPQLYSLIYFVLVVLLTIFVVGKYASYQQSRFYKNAQVSYIWVVLFSIFLITFIGFRPVSDKYFVDMAAYAEQYDVFSEGAFSFNWETDNLIFDNLFRYLSTEHIPVEFFFVFMAAIYYGCIAYACSSLFTNDKMASLLVYLGAFSSFSYATNGIKSGAAASLFLVAIALYEKRKWIWTVLFLLLSLGFHHAMILPVTAFVVCFIIRNPKFYMILWLICLVIAALKITYFQHLFAGFTDEQGALYLLGKEHVREDIFGGFRVDFILYSAAPIVVWWIAYYKRNIRSRRYTFLVNLYLLTNAVWLLCMYAEFTNRIAYLSWLLLPIVLIYPFLNEVWGEKQYKTFMWVAFGHLAFTLFMNFIY